MDAVAELRMQRKVEEPSLAMMGYLWQTIEPADVATIYQRQGPGLFGDQHASIGHKGQRPGRVQLIGDQF